MLLAEDLLILLVPESSGELPRRSGTQSALAAVLAGHKAPTPWSAALLYALNAVDEVTPGPAAMRRAEKLSTSEWPGSAVVPPLVDRMAVLGDIIVAPDLL